VIAVWNGIDIYLKLFILSMVPVVELRGAVIIAAAARLQPLKTLIICVIGNILPVPFILLFLKRFLYWGSDKALIGGICTYLIARSEKKAKYIGRLEFLGLVAFVGIPIPGTGAWTGSLAASVLNMPLKRSAPAIVLGVIIAGIIMCTVSFGISSIF
jgi:uncharacterized membrane protein